MAAATLLFVFFSPVSLAQCLESLQAERTETVSGVTPGADHYYRNLIVQDLALDRKVPFSEVSLVFEYKVSFQVNRCRPGMLEIKAMPVCQSCQPVFYRNFDVARAIRPGAADLVFSLVNQRGIDYDSLVFRGLGFETDSSLYTTLAVAADRPLDQITVRFDRALFHYDAGSYDRFRDHIMKVDEYYAAVALADSVIRWTGSGMLSEEASRQSLLVRWWELGRLLPFFNPERYEVLRTTGLDDPADLLSRYQYLQRMHTRYRMILNYGLHDRLRSAPSVMLSQIIAEWLDKLDYYYDMSFRTDFRNLNFINQMDRLQFSAGSLNDLRKAYIQMSPVSSPHPGRAAVILTDALMRRGAGYEALGNQARAMQYYESAYDVASISGSHDQELRAMDQACRTKNDLVSSLLEISGKALERDNPAMAAQYCERAKEVSRIDHRSCTDPVRIQQFERQLFDRMFIRAAGLAANGAYRKALDYLLEIEAITLRDDRFLLPDGFGKWMGLARQGIYNELIARAAFLVDRDEMEEAEFLYRQATDMRLMGGYAISRHSDEETVETAIRRHYFSQYLEEGQEYLMRKEPDLALYFFNKARSYQQEAPSARLPVLERFRLDAAQQVIDEMISEARLKAWAFEFPEARAITEQVGQMLGEYDIPENDPLHEKYRTTHDEIYRKGCEKAINEYDALMLEATALHRERKYNAALVMARKAVGYSLDHLDCRIRDEAAWYLKIILEPLAEYEQKELELLRSMQGEPAEFLAAYRELQRFYYRKKLLEQGVILPALYPTALKSRDTEFLAGMCRHYLSANDPEKALGMLKTLRDAGAPSIEYRDLQQRLGEKLAKRDAALKNAGLPWETMHGYAGDDRWFRTLKWAYKFSYLKASGYAFRNWPLIWKK